MKKRFNVTGDCKPELHYMVDITVRLQEIERMIERGDYFAINRPRQYGKTTTLQLLSEFLKENYWVLCLDFQDLGSSAYENEQCFAQALASEIYLAAREFLDFPQEILEGLKHFAKGQDGLVTLRSLFLLLEDFCIQAGKPVVLLIDEADQASNHQVFLDFLAQLRSRYLKRTKQKTFQSVILAGVYDITNLKRKFVREGEHKRNSPWNISADYLLDMSFSPKEIAGMLKEYEADAHTGMDLTVISEAIYGYTSGYPVLTCMICKLLDEQLAGTEAFLDRCAAWTLPGVEAAVKRILSSKLMLFASLQEKLEAYPDLREFLQNLLLKGVPISNSTFDTAMDVAKMFGFVKVQGNTVVVANRIFEAALYEMFLNTAQTRRSEMYAYGSATQYEFIKGDTLDMCLILERFVEAFHQIYGAQPDRFLEAEGRRFFLLFLRPIINGKGNYYIEPQTRDQRRMDVVVDYAGEQYIVEMKIWHGDAYNKRGEQQLTEYLDYFGVDKGYLLSFNFNKEKKTGVQTLRMGKKTIVEAVV